MKKKFAIASVLGSILLGAGWLYLQMQIRGQIQQVAPRPGLVVVGWPAGQLQIGKELRPVPAFVTQDEAKSFSLQMPGCALQVLSYSPEDPELQAPSPKVLVEFAHFQDRLVYRWGWLGSLLLAGAGLALLRPTSQPPPEEDSIEAGGGFAGYRLVRVLGQGATGSVWEATQGGRRVAIKVLSPSVLADEGFLDRFRREFEVARRFNHPRLVTCHALGEVKDTFYIVMDYLDGGTLRQLLEKGPVGLKQALKYALQMAQGLSHAHGMGVIHRDLKPDNVLVDQDGQLALADFGLARATDSKTITVTGTVMGTPAYLPPDFLRGEKATPAADMYSLGIVFFELFEGRLPFQDPDVMKIMMAHLDADPPPIQADVPEPVRQLIARLLAKTPESRPTAQEVVKVLKAAQV